MLKGKSAAAALAAAILIGGLGSPAQAANWGTITVYEDSVAQGAGYGTWSSVNGNSSQTDGYLKDLKPAEQSIYYSARTVTQTCNYNCAGLVSSIETGESTRWNGDYWKLWEVDRSISPNYRYDYVYIQVCEDQRFSPDDCSSSTKVGPQ